MTISIPMSGNPVLTSKGIKFLVKILRWVIFGYMFVSMYGIRDLFV